MIKLIATDMDGTFLDSKKEFDPKFIDIFHELNKLHIKFVVASGQQYYRLYQRFIPMSEDICFIAENGTFVAMGSQKLFANEIRRDLVNQAIDIIEKSDVDKYDRFIVQINKNADLLREYISRHNYTIIDEKLVFDGFYYEIIAFNTDYHKSYTSDEISYGPVLLKEKSQTFVDYISYKINTLENIVEQKGHDAIIDNQIKSLKNIINKV